MRIDKNVYYFEFKSLIHNLFFYILVLKTYLFILKYYVALGKGYMYGEILFNIYFYPPILSF